MKEAPADTDAVGAASCDLLNLFGLVALGYMWCRTAEAAQAQLAASPGTSTPHLSGKVAVGRFFIERMLPERTFLLTRIKTGARIVMALPNDAF